MFIPKTLVTRFTGLKLAYFEALLMILCSSFLLWQSMRAGDALARAADYVKSER